MVFLDNLFSKKPSGTAATAQDAGPTNLTADDEHTLDRKSQRLERRELLYAVVRESMARVGVLSTSYKYKVLSLDSRGSQYLIMMDLPKEMAEHIGQLAEIEEVVTQTARMRHKIDVSAVYWRINELSRSPVLRKPRSEAELTPAPAQPAADAGDPVIDGRRVQAGTPVANKRFDPIRPDEVNAFKQALAQGKPRKPATTRRSGPEFAPSEFPSTDFEPTRLNEDAVERTPLSRTQYGDLI